MNILVIPDVGRSFNAVRPEAAIYIGLAKAGHRITILTDPNGPFANAYRENDIRLIDLVPGKKIDLAAIRKINRIIKQENIDIVYATKSRTIPNAAFACVGTKARLVVYRGTTGGLYWHDPANYLSLFHPRVDGIICNCDAANEYVRPKVRKKILPFVTTIYKGHDLAWYQSPKADLKSMGISENAFNLLCVGSDREHKGMRYMIEAAGYLSDLTDLNIILVGNNFDREPFISQIKATGMAERIYQPGFREDVPQIAGACDLFVLPSVREALSRAVLESMAYATPVITSDCGGPTEIVEHGFNGYVVPVKDGKSIAERVRFLYNNRATLKEFSANCQHTIKTKLSHERTVANYIAYFESILAA